MNGIFFLLLFIYSGLMINLVLQCALSIEGVADSKKPVDLSTIIKSIIVFVCIVFLWFILSKGLYSLASGLFIYVLIFPVSAMVYGGFEYIVFRYILKKDAKNESIFSFPGGITAVAVFVCINIANNILETLALSIGFTAGMLLVYLIIIEIRRRAALEAVPFFLRGKPLVLIAMGLLSLIFYTASLLLFRMIGTG